MPADELAHPDEQLLLNAEPELVGRLPWSSNATFLVDMHGGDREVQAIYKPVEGERPLWDFEPGLHRRERAAYVVSEMIGLQVVPPTVLRDGPLGEGSFQLFVDADHSEHYFSIREASDAHDATFRDIAALDLLINNTDRKAGHCLLADDRIWAIDHGLCFAADFKLRTVIWDFAGDDVDEALLERIAPLAHTVPDSIAELLNAAEVEALRHRATKLITERVLPHDPTGQRYPWPLV